MDDVVRRAARAAWEELNRQSPVPPFGYMDADFDKTILDGAYDLEAMVRVVLRSLWQPIESATPGAGAIIVSDGTITAIAEWKDGEWRQEGYGSYEEGSGRAYDMKRPTMWLPLLSPPDQGI